MVTWGGLKQVARDSWHWTGRVSFPQVLAAIPGTTYGGEISYRALIGARSVKELLW